MWGYRHAADTRLVNVHVQRLRSKIERDPERPGDRGDRPRRRLQGRAELTCAGDSAAPASGGPAGPRRAASSAGRAARLPLGTSPERRAAAGGAAGQPGRSALLVRWVAPRRLLRVMRAVAAQHPAAGRRHDAAAVAGRRARCSASSSSARSATGCWTPRCKASQSQAAGGSRWPSSSADEAAAVGADDGAGVDRPRSSRTSASWMTTSWRSWPAAARAPSTSVTLPAARSTAPADADRALRMRRSQRQRARRTCAQPIDASTAAAQQLHAHRLRATASPAEPGLVVGKQVSDPERRPVPAVLPLPAHPGGEDASAWSRAPWRPPGCSSWSSCWA